MVKMQGAEDEGAGSVLKYMTKPEIPLPGIPLNN